MSAATHHIGRYTREYVHDYYKMPLWEHIMVIFTSCVFSLIGSAMFCVLEMGFVSLVGIEASWISQAFFIVAIIVGALVGACVFCFGRTASIPLERKDV